MIFSTFERMVAFRYLRARRRESFISVIAGFSLLGIALGVATLIIVMSVMNGFRAELLGRVLGLNGHMSITAPAGPLFNYDQIVADVRQTTGVVSVMPVIEGQVMVTSANVAAGALVRGIEPSDLAKRQIIAGNIISGSLDRLTEDSIVVGERLATRLGVFPGDTITLVAPQGSVSPFGAVPRMRGYRIAALFKIGMYEYDNSFIYMPIASARLFFNLPEGSVSSLEVLTGDPDRVWDVGRDVRARIGQPVRVFNWQQSNASFVSALKVERNVMFLILTLIILVAAFNIISSLIMLVKDKGRDIAVLRAMGATKGMILRIFFLSGASVGVAGTIAGFILGLLFCLNIETIRGWVEALTGTTVFAPEIYFLSKLPAKVDPVEVATIVLMALSLSVLATIYPSWRAARLHPAEALRDE